MHLNYINAGGVEGGEGSGISKPPRICTAGWGIFISSGGRSEASGKRIWGREVQLAVGVAEDVHKGVEVPEPKVGFNEGGDAMNLSRLWWGSLSWNPELGSDPSKKKRCEEEV